MLVTEDLGAPWSNAEQNLFKKIYNRYGFPFMLIFLLISHHVYHPSMYYIARCVPFSVPRFLIQ